MADLSATYKCDQPGCDAVYKAANALGIHKRTKHGIPGKFWATARLEPRRRGRPPKQQFRCDQPGCDAVFGFASLLGRHKQAKHGIAGKSAAALYKRTQAQLSNGEKGETKQHAIVKSTSTREAATRNGHAPERVAHRQQRFVDSGIDAAVAVAFGRVQELCRSVAHEYDIPSRMFTARVAELLHAATIR